MAKEKKEGDKPLFKYQKNVKSNGAWGFALFMSWVGAVVYFVQQSEGFWGFILAVLKACVWPAFLIHKAFELMGV